MAQNVGRMRDHWLDEVFEASGKDVDRLINHPRFKAAMVAARTAYEEVAAAQKADPQMIGGTPAQSARSAFLQAAELQVEYQE